MLATKIFLFTILFIGLNAIPIEVDNLKISPELTEELVKNKLNKNLFLSELTDLELNKAIADLRKEQILNELFNQDISMNDDSNNNNIENLMGQYKHEKRSSLKNHHKMAYSSMLGKLNHSGK